MAFLPFAVEDAKVREGLPGSLLLNLYVVPTPSGPAKFALVDRPGLIEHNSLSGASVRGVYRKAGVFGGDLFSVVGSTIYRGSASLGSVASDGEPARMAASDTQLVVVSGGYAYCYNGTALTPITDPDLPSSVWDVAYLSGRFVYQASSSDQYAYSAIGDATSIGGLDFATAESSPDFTRTVETLGDDLIFFGGDSIEFWNPSNDPDAPFVRSSGRRYDKGIRGRTSVMLDNAPYWLGNDSRVYRGGAVPNGVSTAGLEERIAECSDLARAFAYGAVIKGQTFYVLTLPGVGTWAYQISADKWAEWGSFQRDTFRPSCAVTYQGATYLGDSASGSIWTMDASRYDDAGEALTRRAGVFAPMLSGTARNTNVSLLATKGVGTATEQGRNPVVEMRYSDANDANWSPWMQESLGVQGDRTIKTTWWQLGMMQSPGRAYQFQISDPIPFTAYGVTLNEARP